MFCFGNTLINCCCCCCCWRISIEQLDYELEIYTAVSRKVVLQKRKSERDHVESYMANDGIALDWLKPKVFRR